MFVSTAFVTSSASLLTVVLPRRQALLSLANTLGDAYRQEVSNSFFESIELLACRGADAFPSQAARTMMLKDLKPDAEEMYSWSLRT